MKLCRLDIKNIRGLKDGRYSFGAGTRPVTIVTGAPSAGKTSLLRAIAAARRGAQPFSSPVVASEILTSQATTGRVDAEWLLNGTRYDVRFRVGERARPELPSALEGALGARGKCTDFEWIPARRGLPAALTTPILQGSIALEMESRFLEAEEKYAGLWRYLADQVARAAVGVVDAVDERGVVFKSQLPDVLAHHKAAVATMCPALRMLSVEPRERLRPLIWFQTRDGGRVEIAQASDSELQGFLFACAFTWLGLNRSLILIDTPELHIHPGDHARFFQAICDLGRDNQIIAATSSPAILASVSPDQIIDLARPPERSS